MAAIRAKYAGTMKFLSPDSPLFKRQAAMMEKDIADARGTGGVGLPNALPSTGGPASTKERREADSIIAGGR